MRSLTEDIPAGRELLKCMLDTQMLRVTDTAEEGAVGGSLSNA